MGQKFDDFSMQQAMAMMKTPEGRKLLSLLQQSAGRNLQKAVNQASSGDYSEAKKIITEFLSSPQAQEILGKKE